MAFKDFCIRYFMEYKMKMKYSSSRFPLPFFWEDAGIFNSVDEAKENLHNKYKNLGKEKLWLKTKSGMQLVTYLDVPTWSGSERGDFNVILGLHVRTMNMSNWAAYEEGLISDYYVHAIIKPVKKKA